MSCTPPRTPSPGTVTSMPVSVIMIGKRDGTAEPVAQQPKQQEQEKQQPKQEQQQEEKPTSYDDAPIGEKIGVKGPILPGSQIIFVENKNTNRHLRNANFGLEQIFVANKDTNREAGADLHVNRADFHEFQHLTSRSSHQLLINSSVPELSGNCQVNNRSYLLYQVCYRQCHRFNVLQR